MQEELVASGTPFNTDVNAAKKKLAWERKKLWEHRVNLMRTNAVEIFIVLIIIALMIIVNMGIVIRIGDCSVLAIATLLVTLTFSIWVTLLIGGAFIYPIINGWNPNVLGEKLSLDNVKYGHIKIR